MTTNNHPAHGPVSLDRLHQIREILSKAAAQSDGGNLGYAMADAVKVIDGAIAAFGAEPVAWQWEYRDKRHVTNDQRRAKIVAADGEVLVQPLYTTPPAPVAMKAHQIRELVNDLRDIAIEYHGAQQLRERIARTVRAAMLQSGNFRENKSSSTNNFREIAETSTNYPVIPSEVLSAILKVAKIRADFDDFDGDRRGIGDCLDEAEQELIVTINKYASQLAAEPIATNDVREQTAVPPVPVIQADVAQAIEKLKRKLVECNRYNYCADAVKGVEYACHAAMLQGSQPVSQTYKFPVNTPCQDAPAHIWLQTAGVWPEDGELSELTWCSHNQHHDDTLYVRADLVNGNSPVTPDGWISCSERMPAQDDWILIYSKHGEYMAGQVQGEYVELSDGTLSWLGNALFWMLLPEPPQEAGQ